MTTATGRIETLDGYRAVAAIGVLVYHCGANAGFLVPVEPGAHLVNNLGNFFVAVFFVLSGFLLFRPFVVASIVGRSTPEIAPFWTRRALRIFPAYWLALIAWSLTLDEDARITGTTAGKVLLFDPYDPRATTVFSGLGVSWTLTIELSFYAALPLWAVLMSRVLRDRPSPATRLRVHLVGLGAWYALAVGYRLWLRSTDVMPRLATHWLFAYLDWFAVGMVLAVASAWTNRGGSLPRAFHDLADRTWACWSLALLCFLSLVLLRGQGLGWDADPEDALGATMRHLLQSTGAGLLLLPAVLGRRHGPGMALLGSRPLVWLGTVSYGIYLWHTIVIKWVDGLFDAPSARLQWLLLSVVVLAVTVVISALSYHLVERPFIRLGQRGRPTVPVVHAPFTGARIEVPIGAATE